MDFIDFDDFLGSVGIDNFVPPNGATVAVLMSGGVDSSFAAVVCQRLGYHVLGITAQLTPEINISGQLAAEQLGIEHHNVDLREQFKNIIIEPFINSYKNGETPVPCMNCNTEIKFGLIYEYARSLGVQYLASGHYIRILREGADNALIARPTDSSKDQTYMLWRLTHAQRTSIFAPLANITKKQIRLLAAELGLVSSDKAESQDICFVNGKNSEFLQQHIESRVGEIQHTKTKLVLGTHMGTHLFTIGQRKGIGLAASEPLYVISTDHKNNILYVGEQMYLYSDGLVAEQVNWHVQHHEEVDTALAKIRYASAPAVARVTHIDTETMQLSFAIRQSSITKGQATVLYNPTDKYILGGGWIARSI